MDFVVKDHSVYRNRSVIEQPNTGWMDETSRTSEDSLKEASRHFRAQQVQYPVTDKKAFRSESFSFNRSYNIKSKRVYPKILMEHLNDYYLDSKSKMLRVQAQLRRIHNKQLPMVYLSPEEPSIDERFD